MPHPNRRRFLQFLSGVAAGPATLHAAGAPPRPAAAPPNVVILLADDLGWNDVGYHGSAIRTANIDRIAREGLELDRFYVCPICSPTRAGMMTGRYPLRFGIMRAVIPPWRKYGLPNGEETLPETLARAGYTRRGVFGKWHLGHSDGKYHPLKQGFTHFVGCYNGACDYFTQDREGERDWHRGYDTATETGYTTNLIADKVVTFINESPAGEPFLAYVPFTAPHTPLQAPQEYIDKYPSLSGQRRTFAAMVHCMDDAIGRILAVIDKKGIADNTIVWFISDNGGGTGSSNLPLRGSKQTVFEGGIRVPAAVRWPAGGLKGGRKVSAVMGYIDVLPTLASIVAQKPGGKAVDGVDVSGVLRGDADEPERNWFSYWAQSGPEERLAVITGEWKLVRIGPDILTSRPGGKAKVYLFRIREDPNEKTDVSAKHPKVVKQLLAELKTFRAQRSAKGLPPYSDGRKGFTPPKEWRIPGS